MFSFSFYKEEANTNIFWGNRKYLYKSREYGKSVAKSMMKEPKRNIKIIQVSHYKK